MKNKILRGGLFIAIISLMTACGEKKEPMETVDKDAIKSEIQAMEEGFAAGFNARNVDNIMYYAEDAISYSPGKKPLEGRTAIHDAMKEELATFPIGAKVSFETKEVHISNDGNQVVEIGGYTVVDSTNTKLMTGNFFSLFEKKDGKYVCTRDIMNSDMPEPKK